MLLNSEWLSYQKLHGNFEHIKLLNKKNTIVKNYSASEITLGVTLSM